MIQNKIKNVNSIKYFLICTISLLGIIIIISCNSTEPKTEFRLSLEDASCTEVWLKLEGAASNEIKLERDGKEIKNYELIEGNIIYDNSLMPNTTYTYQARLTSDIQKNMEVIATTLDTTSSNYTWKKFYFGNIGSSHLNDVAILDDNNIWAVGSIEISEDGKDYTIHGLAKWDGTKWEINKIRHNCRLYYPNCGPDTISYLSASSIFALAPNNVWISAGGVHHYDGNNWTEEAGIYGAGRANEIWGTEDALWFVGNEGFIARRNSDGSWIKIESGTELDIQDIWGDYDHVKGKWEILAVASENMQNNDYLLLNIEGENVTHLRTEPIKWSIISCWFKNSRKYIVAGNGIYEKTALNEEHWKNEALDISQYAIYKIRGASLNDIIAVGGYGEVTHYNGINWKSHHQTTLIDGNYKSVAVEGDFIVAVGQNNTQAIITVGRR